MSDNIFDDYNKQSQEALQGVSSLLLKDISNEYALSTPMGKRSAFYKTTFLNQAVKDKDVFEVKIRVLAEDDAGYVHQQYKREVVDDTMIKLFLVVKDESLIDKGKQNDIRNANIRVSNISEFTGVVLGDKIYELFTDYPEKMDKYVDKLGKDFIESDSQLPFIKETLYQKFNHYMENKRSQLFPLGKIAQMIQNELKKDLQEFWKPVLTSLADDIRALKMEDEKYWQPYTPEGLLKPDKAFEPLVGETVSDAQEFITKFFEPFDAIDNVLKDYLNLNKIEDAKELKPKSQSTLKKALVKIYELFKELFDYFRAGITKFINSLANKVYELNAFLVGVINGVIEFVASLFDIMGFLAGLMSGDAHLLWQAVKKAYKTLQEKGAFSYIFEVLGKFFANIGERYKTSQTRYKLLKNLGEDLIGIIEFILTAIAALKTAKAVTNASKQLYNNFKNKIDDIVAKRKNEFDKISEGNELYKKIEELFDASGGRLLNKKEINLLKDFLWQKYGVRVRLVDVDHKLKTKLKDWDNRNVVGSFKKGPPPELFLRSNNASELTVFHEMVHLKYWFDKKPKLHFAQEEIVVFEEIWKTKNRWTNQELLESYYYAKDILKKANLSTDLKNFKEKYQAEIRQIELITQYGI